jgi:hypothetical protein
MHATITITAKSWDESRVWEVDPSHAIAQARFTTTWSGAADGESTCWLLISYVDGDPTDPQTLIGPYAGYEQATGTLAGRRGSFVMAVAGHHGAGVARTQVTVVSGSATGELAGLRGGGSYAATGMEYTLELDYEIG